MRFAISTAKSDHEFAKKLRSGEIDQFFLIKILNMKAFDKQLNIKISVNNLE